MADATSLDPTLINRFDIDPDRLIDLLGDGLGGVDDGELFIEYRETESFGFDDGRLKNAAFDTSQGFGLRAVAGEAVGCAHSPDFTEAAVVRALDAVGAVRAGHSGQLSLPSQGTNQRRYTSDNPIQAKGTQGKSPFSSKSTPMQEPRIPASSRSAPALPAPGSMSRSFAPTGFAKAIFGLSSG